MRLFLIAVNFIAIVGLAIWGRGLFMAYDVPGDRTMIVIVFGSAIALLALNLAYIKTTPPVFFWRERLSRFRRAWTASKDDGAIQPRR